MAGLMVLNPRKAGGKKRRRKMTAKQLKFFGPRKGKRKKAKLKAAKRKKAAPKIVIVENNPKRATVAKTKRRRHRKAKRVFAHNPKSKRRRFRRNPRSIEAGFFNNTLVPAAIGAAGAIGTDMLVGYLPLPAQFKTGMMLPLIRIAGSLLIGAAIGAVSSREAGEEAAAGGVIVTLYSMAQGFGLGAMPGAMNRYAPMHRYAPMRRFNAMGSMPPGSLRQPGAAGRGMGYISPARVSGPGGPAGFSRANMRFIASQR